MIISQKTLQEKLLFQISIAPQAEIFSPLGVCNGFHSRLWPHHRSDLVGASKKNTRLETSFRMIGRTLCVKTRFLVYFYSQFSQRTNFFKIFIFLTKSECIHLLGVCTCKVYAIQYVPITTGNFHVTLLQVIYHRTELKKGYRTMYSMCLYHVQVKSY